MKQWQRYLAETLGTFVLVFLGATSIVAAFELNVTPELIAPFAFGLALMAGLYSFAEISGGHFNPAVSLGMYLDRRITFDDLISYWIAQFTGAILASLLMLGPFDRTLVKDTATVPQHGNGQAFVIEIVFTAIFVLVILQSTKSERYRGSALIAIPLTLLAIHFAAIPISGSSVNPARSLGPALVGNRWDAFWIYAVGPPLGAIIAWLVYTVVITGDTNLGGRLRPPQRRTRPAHPS
jgi:aquaporin Z